MSLVDYGFYSDEEEEEEEREAEPSQQQELLVAGPCRTSDSRNGNVVDRSFHPHTAVDSASSEVSPQQVKGTEEAFCVGKEEDAAGVPPSAREKRSAASVIRGQPDAEESPSVDPSAFYYFEEEEAGEAAGSPATERVEGRRRAGEGVKAAAEAAAQEGAVGASASDATTAATRSRKRARENCSTESNAAASSTSAPTDVSLLHPQLLQPGGTSPRDGSSCGKQQQSGTFKLLSADGTAKAGPSPSADSEQDAPRPTAAGGTPSSLAGVPSPAPLPTLPPGEAPKELLRTVERLRQLRARGITVNGNIAASLDFKNPYLLEKIMKVFDIDPYCSNYPVSVFDPSNVIPWEPRTGTPFAVHIVRRFEQRRQQRRELHASKDAKEDTPAAAAAANSAAPGTHAAAPGAAAASGVASASASAVGTQQAAVALPAETTDAPLDGSTHRPRSRFERISPPEAGAAQQQQQHTAAPASGFTSTAGLPAAGPLMTGAGLNAALQQAAFEAMAKAGAMASVVQQQLQQRLLTMHSALAQQKQHCASMANRDASSAAALAAAAAAAAVSYRTQQQPSLQHQQHQVQQNGPSAAATGSNNHLRPSGLPVVSPPPASHAAVFCGGSSTSSATVTGSASLQGGPAVAVSDSRSGVGSGGTEEERLKIKKVDKSSVGHQGEAGGAAAAGAPAQQQQRPEPTHRRQTASVISSTRWGDARGEHSAGSSASLTPRHIRSLSSTYASTKKKHQQ